jgi:hypothetical protein
MVDVGLVATEVVEVDEVEDDCDSDRDAADAA